ncbi:MAG: protein kinase [Victivallales bacterium]|nr:protein kinase [Victivallales bacterium]
MLKPGDTIAGCTIVAECGHGAYGYVYLANDVLGRSVAVKLLTTVSSGEYELKGLRNYINLVQPCEALIRIFLCGQENGLVFYVMEAADNASPNPGGYQPDTLALRLQRNNGRLPAAEALAICRKLLDGLEVLHNAGLVHRDIKPENVIFVNGLPKLADPGLVRNVEQTLSVAGTPGYIGPEFFSGKAQLSPAMDIYALGKLLYHCVTGCNPADFPMLPDDLPPELLFQICHPLLRLCNDSAEQRCKSAAECRAILPKEISRHNALLRFRDALYVQPRFRRRVLRGMLVFVSLLLILCGSFAFARYIITKRQQEFDARLTHIANDIQQMQEDNPSLDLQLASLNAPTLDKLLNTAKARLEAKDAKGAETELAAAKNKLLALATANMPSKVDDFDNCARAWGFLASPLAQKYLPQKVQNELKARLKKSSAALSNSSGLELGSNLSFQQSIFFDSVFVPPGLFLSPTLGKPCSISYPYWIFGKEISCSQFTEITHLEYRRNSHFQAAEFLSWNEALYYCWEANELLRRIAFVPEGYGVRPPTEEEWEYAALGGWNGKATKDGPKVKDATNKAPGQGTPNALGIWNMEDNVSELVLPYKEKSLNPYYALVARGGNYHEKTGITTRHIYIPDQVFMKGAGGLRPVIAPIEKDFWEKKWFRGVAIKSAEIDGGMYAGWSICHASITWQSAVQLATDLGGTLPEATDPAMLKPIFTKLKLIHGFPCPLGLHADNGVWRRVSDNEPVSMELRPLEQKKSVYATSSKVTLISESMASPTIIIYWKDKEAFAKRKETFLEKATVLRFQANGHSYAVCRIAGMTSYMVRSFATFMECQLPVFKDGNEVKAVMDHIPSDLNEVALGATRFYNKWEQPDGSVFPASNDVHQDSSNMPNYLSARIHNAIVVIKKELTESDTAKFMLVEL